MATKVKKQNFIVKNHDFVRIGRGIKPDTRRRVVLPSAFVREDITYCIFVNSDGQIMLDPQVTIPASELWLFQNKDILAMVDKGMAEEKVIDRGSFAKYIKNEP